MAKDKDILDSLFDGETVSTPITYQLWKPWEVGTDPKGFKGIYEGYKVLEGEKDGKITRYPGFCFKDCELGGGKPAPSPTYLVCSGMVNDLARVEPGTRVAIIYRGEKSNKHKGKSHDLEVHVLGVSRDEAMSSRAHAPMNMIENNSERKALAESSDIPF